MSSGGGYSDRREFWGGVDQATIMSLELLSGILVWGGAGWLLDRWLGTLPWFFTAGVMLGFGAGLYLIWLRSGGSGTSATDHKARRVPGAAPPPSEEEGPIRAGH